MGVTAVKPRGPAIRGMENEIFPAMI